MAQQQSYPLGINPLPGYRFTVSINGMLMGFQKISGIRRQIEIETYQEGGMNTRVHVFPKSCSGEQLLHMEKGIYAGIWNPFSMVGEKLDGVLSVIVMNQLGIPLKSYLFTGLLVKTWEVGEMSAEQNGVLIDSFEVSYEDFQVVM